MLFHPAHPGLVIKWAQLKFTLQVVPAAPGVSANASFHFTARVISTQHHQDTVHDGFRILVGRRQSGPCSICYVVEMRMCGTPCLLYLARILTLSLESSTASLPHLEYNVHMYNVHSVIFPQSLSAICHCLRSSCSWSEAAAPASSSQAHRLTVHCRQITARPAHHLHLMFFSMRATNCAEGQF